MMVNKKALQLASVASMIDQFNIPNIRILQSLGYQVDVVADFTNPGTITKERAEDLKKRLNDMNVHVYDIKIPRSLNPGAISKAYKEVKNLVSREHYNLIHCHSPIGGVICRQAARGERKKGSKVIYTAHGFHFYDGAPLKNWLIFYPIEKHLSRYTDVLITINKEDYKRASDKFYAKKTLYVPGIGVDIEKFAPRQSGRKKIRAELGLADDQLVLLSVGEMNEIKNHSSVIKAIKGIEKFTYVIVGKGEKEKEIKSLAENLGVDLRLTGFRNDVADFYDAADVYVLPSIREGLNVSLMEAMASGLAVACGGIRGYIDLLQNEDVLFDPMSAAEIKKAVTYTAEHREKLGQMNLERIKAFDLSTVDNLIPEIYRGEYEHLIEVLHRQEKRIEIGIPLDAFLLMSVGELNENKNHNVVIRAIGKISDVSVHYTIVGKGDLMERYEQLALDLGVDKRVHILGFRSDIPELYAAADVCVFPSIREGLGLAAVEGMASGLPMIVSDNRGTRDLVSGIQSFICDYEDSNAFASAIEQLKVNIKLRQMMQKESLSKSKKFDQLIVNEIMRKIYSAI